MRNVNGRLNRLERLLDKKVARGLSTATRRYINAMLDLIYDPAGLHQLPTPDELEQLGLESQEFDPVFWSRLRKVYGSDRAEYEVSNGID